MTSEARLTAEDERTPAELEWRMPVPKPERTMLPVSAPPRVNDWRAVVWSDPAAVKKEAPVVPAETEAVGVPEFIFNTENLAEAVDTPPTSRSRVELLGVRIPRLSFCVHLEEAVPMAPLHEVQAGALAPETRQRPEVAVVAPATTPVPEVA